MTKMKYLIMIILLLVLICTGIYLLNNLRNQSIQNEKKVTSEKIKTYIVNIEKDEDDIQKAIAYIETHIPEFVGEVHLYDQSDSLDEQSGFSGEDELFGEFLKSIKDLNYNNFSGWFTLEVTKEYFFEETNEYALTEEVFVKLIKQLTHNRSIESLSIAKKKENEYTMQLLFSDGSLGKKTDVEVVTKKFEASGELKRLKMNPFELLKEN